MNDVLIVKNVKCFTEPEPAVLAPLTLLVGENSTGKSTLLALCRIGWDIAFGRVPPDFNEEPFLLGAYDQIANYRGGRGGRAKSFEITWEEPIHGKRFSRANASAGGTLAHTAVFTKSGSQAFMSSRSLRRGGYALTATDVRAGSDSTLELVTPGNTYSLNLKEMEEFGRLQIGNELQQWEQIDFFLALRAHRKASKRPKQRLPTERELEIFLEMLRPSRFGAGRKRPYACAPVRTKPERTYNPISSIPRPEGGHVPMVLAKTHFEGKQRWDLLASELEKFGSGSGLFESLEVRPLGKSESDPFQINVKISGPAFNLIDVGYGVSQVLPILVDTVLGEEGGMYLLQQPEVHLHPRGQAELGSFFGYFASKNRRFVVETHSDYLIDRVRMDVRDKKMPKPDDVAIIFFERHGSEVSLRNMKLDEEGNLINVPDNYRRFFLNEERRLLGI